MSQPPYGPPPTVEQGYYGHHAPPPPKKKRTGLKIFLGGVVALVLMGGCAALLSGGPEETPTGAADKPKAQAKAPGGDKDKEAEAEPETPGIGAVVKDGKFAFKVTKLSRATQVGNSFLNKDAQGVFWLISVTVKNIGDESQAFFGDAQKVYDKKGREYEADSEAALYLENSKSLYEKINPGNTVRGVVLFDLPKGVQPTKIELHDSLFSGGVTVGLQ